MARFVAGDRVITTRNRAGAVRHVFQARLKTSYSVALDGQQRHQIFDECELRAETAAPPASVRCGDCKYGQTTLLSNARRCVIFKQFRSAGAPRQCGRFSPSNPGG